MASTIQFHNVVKIKTRPHTMTTDSGHSFDCLHIMATDMNGQFMDVDFFMEASASHVAGSITYPAADIPAPVFCVLDMTRKFAVNGLADELAGLATKDNPDVSVRDMAEAVVRYIESYGAKFQGDDAV